jgi:hypothetical protein
MEARLAAQRDDFARRVQPRAEAHRLDGRAAGERLAGDAVRKTRVVLDPRARPRLAADRDRVERDRAQALGGAVDRSGEPGRAAADDDEVEDVPGRRLERQPEVRREISRRRAPHRVGRRDHRRQIAALEREALEQRLRVVGLLDVDPRVREVRVLGERAQRHRLGRIARSDDPDRLRALARAQDLAPREQRVEDRFGQFRATAHQAAELLLGDDEHAPALRHAAAERAALTRQQVQLADEAAAAVADDHHGVGAVAVDDLDVALEHDEQVIGGFTGFEQHLAGRDRPLYAEGRDLLELGSSQVAEGTGVLVGG